MDDVRASSAWVATHSSHVVVDSAGFRLMAKKFGFLLVCKFCNRDINNAAFGG